MEEDSSVEKQSEDQHDRNGFSSASSEITNCIGQNDCTHGTCWDDHDIEDCRKHHTLDAKMSPIQCTEDLPEGQLNAEFTGSENKTCSRLQQVDDTIDLPLTATQNRDGCTYENPIAKLESGGDYVNEKELKLYTFDEGTEKKLTSSDSRDQNKTDTCPLEIAQYLKYPSSSRQQHTPVEIVVCMLPQQVQQLPTPVPVKQPDEEPPFPEGCREEMRRLATYFEYPTNCSVFVIKLSGDGFVYRHQLKAVECVFCRLRITLSELSRPGFDPVKEHALRAPDCPLKKGIDCGNAPVPKADEYAFSQQASGSPKLSVPVEATSRNTGRPAEISYALDAAPVQPPPTVQPHFAAAVTDSAPFIEQPQPSTAQTVRGKPNASRKQNSESPSNASVGTTESSRSTNSNTARSSPRKPSSRSSGSNSNASSGTAASAQTSTTNKNNTASNNPSSGGKEEPPKEKKKLTYSDLGIFAEKPKREDMATLQKRLSTFTHKWKSSHTQTPQMLAEAGMYYAGYADCARCFFCGGGLKNWEPPDSPWIEHARWFPKCGYIRMCKGPMFVEIVQRKNKNKEPITLKDVDYEISLKIPQNDPFDTRTPVADSTSIGSAANSTTTAGASSGTAGGVASHSISPKDLDHMEKENEELKTQITCKICMDKDSSVVFLPCGHLVACTTCAIALKLCPLCRAEIKGSVRAHMSD